MDGTLSRGVRLGLAVVAAVAGFGAGTPAFAQMPNVAQMSGVPLPVADLPAGTVVVRVVRGDITNNIANQKVELQGGPSVLTVVTDADGHAEFRGLAAGTTVHAAAIVDGKRVESQPFAVPSTGGVRVVLAAGAGAGAVAAAGTVGGAAAGAPAPTAPAQPGSVVLSSQSQFVVELNDDQLEVYYLLQITNASGAPVAAEPLVFDLPDGARDGTLLEGSSQLASVDGPRLTIRGPFPPGSTAVQLAYAMSPGTDTLTLSQKLPATLEGLSLVMTKFGEMHFESPQVTSHGEMPSEGRTFLVGSGPAIKAGDSLTFTITGLPHQAVWPRWLALGLAAVILVWGGVAAFSVGGEAAAAADRRRMLRERRDRLFADLVRIEQEYRAGSLDEPRYGSRRRELVAQLERIYGELDEGLAA